MAPDAPAPIYDSNGNVVVAWSIDTRYDPITDEIVLSWHQERGPYQKEARGHERFPATGPDAVRSALLLRLSILSARRLF